MSRDLPPVFSAKDASRWLHQSYSAPHKLLESMVKSGHLFRLKRGVYAFQHHFDPLMAAQFLHSPSYLSFETALAYYGMIPERTHQIQSVADARPMRYRTCAGTYIYHAQRRDLFAEGMSIDLNGIFSLPIANPEKALLDTLWRAQLKARQMDNDAVWEYVVDGLRLEQSDLENLSLGKLQKMAPMYRNFAPRRFVEALKAAKS